MATPQLSHRAAVDMITVHAPQSRLSQPYLVPVRLDASRSAHSSGVVGVELVVDRFAVDGHSGSCR